MGDDGWGLVGSESDGARGWRLASGSGEAGCARPASAGWWAEASARRRGRVTRGRPALGERGEELGRTGICWATRDERKGAAVMDWVGLVGLLLGFFFSWIFLILFYFFSGFQTQIYLKLLCTHSNKIMHQHECTNKFKPTKILIPCETKLNASLSILNPRKIK